MHLKESWVRIPLPKDVRLSRQPLTGEHTKLGAILAGGDMVSLGLAEARYRHRKEEVGTVPGASGTCGLQLA